MLFHITVLEYFKLDLNSSVSGMEVLSLWDFLIVMVENNTESLGSNMSVSTS